MAYHGSLLIRNQTVFEKNKAIHKYDLYDWKVNVKESLGDNWYLVWISPLIASQMPRNGLYDGKLTKSYGIT
ncbi:putative palmitoyltransferase ZDHHC24-like protein [Leptotrombidium deliense]|uniref:Putative palmitoyltransferase ZDHHC24-like protein n=1 Tax=Leptotrombidium deliense TaxID=299467 RepID=A0A443SE39_9ACAR|nr:putative palmitoyltransferase ZDHHC24-like protein [Leptotrombidium deliense]